MTDPVLAARSRVALATRHGNTEAATAARRELTAAKLARAIEEALAAEPALAPERRSELSLRLAGN